MATSKKSTGAKKAPEKEIEQWSNIRGKMRVYAHQVEYTKKNKTETFTAYSTSVGKKNNEGEYDNIYFNVMFKRGEEINIDEGAIYVNVKKGFITLTKGKKDVVYPSIMILEYEEIEE